MTGTVVVATMAWRVYGPPADQLQPFWTRAQQALAELLQPAAGEQMAEGTPPALFDETAAGLVPLAEIERRVDDAVGPAGWHEPPNVANSQPPLYAPPAGGAEKIDSAQNSEAAAAMSAVYERLRHLGIEQYSLSPWG